MLPDTEKIRGATMLEFPISSKMIRHISEQAALINSPQYQEQIKLLNSSEYREMLRFLNSPVAQEEMRHLNSPAVQDMIKHANSLRTQAKADPDAFVQVKEDTLTSLRAATPLIPEESQEKFNEITTIEQGEGWKILTAENIKWLLGIIIPIIVSICLYNLGSKNAEEQLELLSGLNEIGEEIVELLDRNSEESYEDFPEEIPGYQGVFNEDVDAISDLVAPDRQDNDAANQSSDQNLKP